MVALKATWYPIEDSDECVAVVRCAAGDRETFDRLADDALNTLGIDAPHVKTPIWRWYRMNPDWTRTYNWVLGLPDGPGYGNWMGALVVVTYTPTTDPDQAPSHAERVG